MPEPLASRINLLLVPLRQPIQRFLVLSGVNQRRFLFALAALPVIDGVLRWRGLDETITWLDRRSPLFGKGGSRHVVDAHGMAEVIATAGRWSLFNGTCLRQALLVRFLLRRRGCDAQLCLGVNRVGGFVAHAWVELDGVALGQKATLAEDFTCVMRR